MKEIKTVGIIFADEMEYIPFLNFAKERNAVKENIFGKDSVSFKVENEKTSVTVTAIKSGVGKSNAASAAAYLIGAKKADCVLNAGLSGAVSRFKKEDIVAGESFVECDFDLTALGYKLGTKADGEKSLYMSDEYLLSLALEIPGIKKGKCGSGDVFLADKDKKELYKSVFSIEAFDMETGAMASVCDKAGIPFLSLRKISDDTDDASAESYREMNEKKEMHLTNLLFEIILKMIR